MAFGGFNDDKQQAPMSDINVTPMVDVMLVLLVIFIITAPLFTHAIRWTCRMRNPHRRRKSRRRFPCRSMAKVRSSGTMTAISRKIWMRD